VISKKMLSLLTAVTLSGGVAATTAVVAPSVIASEQTMAEQYEPYYEDVVGQGESLGFYARLKSDSPLPAGTRFLLEGKREDGISYFLSTSNDGDIYFSRGGGLPATGATVYPRVTVLYPDGSAEEIVASITLIPPHADSYSVGYGDVEVAPDSSEDFQLQRQVPTGTRISVLNLPNVTELTNTGWAFAFSEDGNFSVSSPENAEGPFTLQLLVEYPDGTSETSSVTINVVSPQNELHEVTYRGVDVTGGDTVTASPTETDLPAGTRITLADNTALTAAGWDLEVTADGELTATAPNDADGTVEIALTVTYPDGTTEETTAKVAATPAPTDDEDDEDDQSVDPNRPKAGGSSFGSS
jgi:hypothetical protein